MCHLKIAFQTAFPVCVKQWGKLRYGIFLLQMGKGGTSILPFMRKGIRTLRLRGSRTRCPLYNPFRFCRHPRRTRQTRGLRGGGSTDQIPCWDRRSVVCPHSDWRQIPILWCLRSPIWVVATLVLPCKSTWGSARGVRDQPSQGFDEFRCL